MSIMIPVSPRQQPALVVALQGLLLIWLIFAALWYAATGLVTIANFAWPQLAFDQFRSYNYYLGMPYPDNVMMMENGHRPIIPALLRVLEIHAFAANQYLQIAFGAACAALTAAVIAVTAWREAGYPVLVRAAGVVLAVVAIFWLGNARMLLHGAESSHTYLIMLCLVAGALMVRRSATRDSAGWMLGAGIACMVATFAFGTGIALFPTFLILGWLLGARWRHLLNLGAMLVLCLVLYLFVLPGDGGVRGSLEFRLFDSLSVAARWLASPWITGWLGYADPQTHPIELRTPLGLALKGAANGLQALLHVEMKTTGALLIGLAGMLLAFALGLAKAFRRGPMTATRSLGFALMMFATGAAVVVGIGRLAYFDQADPGQIFADRYLPWTCLFWLGLGLLMLSICSERLRGVRWLLIAFASLLPIVLLPFHQYGGGWGAAVYQLNQASAAAAMSNLFDDRLFATNDDATQDQRVLSYQLLRENHLGPYRFAGSEQLGQRLAAPVQMATPDIRIAMQPTTAVRDIRDGSPGAQFEGTVQSGIRLVRDRGPLAVIDADQRIVGYAIFSNVGKPMRSLALALPVKRGFHGYVKAADPAGRYRLVSLDASGIGGVAWDLGEIPPATR